MYIQVDIHIDIIIVPVSVFKFRNVRCSVFGAGRRPKQVVVLINHMSYVRLLRFIPSIRLMKNIDFNMLTLHIAYTEPVNSSTDPSIPTLTREQVWNGLKLKARCPQEFIPAFDDSRVIEEGDNGSYIVREAHVSADLRGSPMAGQWTREECRFHESVKVSAWI